MRKLVILRGAMGCGKSTFIKECNLERFTLSSDNIRLMFNAPEMNINYKEEIPQYNNKKVWNLLYSLLEERMKKGEFTIIDAVHATNDSLTIYKKLALKYRYRLYIVDFTDIDIEEVYKRNKCREKYKIVSEYVIDRTYKLFSKEKISNDFIIVKPDKFDSIINNTPRDFNNYDKIHIIGDIHGCFRALNEYLNNINDNDLYIFVGDYFDRGIENYKIFRYLNELSNNKNMIFLVGNHEDKLYKYACGDEFKLDYNIINTIKELEDNNIKKSEIRGFIKKLAQLSYFTFGNNTYLVTHGGIPYIPDNLLDFYSTNSFIYGIDKYDVDIDKIYNDYIMNSDNKIYQIHGHRNYFKIKYNEYKYSINLDGDIEHGGYLRIVTINKDGKLDYNEIKNNIYNPNLIEEENIYNLIEDLKNNKYVYEKEIDNNIHSFNFSKEAFYNKIWNNITTKARGLFIDINNYKIIARSYDKFFKINEGEDTKLDNIINNIVYPVNFYLKYNGFLGIVSVSDNELFFTTKSSNTGNYVEYFKNIFYKKYNDLQIEAIKNKIINDNVSFVFEVIDNINDPHIIEYNDSNIILLDIIYNTTNYNKLDYNKVKEFSNSFNIEIKKLIYIANNLEDFMNIYNNITSNDYKYNNEYIEGFVIEDSNKLMLKTKTYYYDKWKYLRSKMENCIKNNNYKLNSKYELENNFIKYLKSKYENKDIDLSSVNIINERRKFEDRGIV